MKYLFLLIPFLAFAHPEQEQRIQALELRVKMLEQQKSSSSGLKTIDMGNKKMNSASGMGLGGQKAPKITPEQRKQLEDSLKQIKDMQKQQMQMLKELDNEGL
jgi:hypothetical protein